MGSMHKGGGWGTKVEQGHQAIGLPTYPTTKEKRPRFVLLQFVAGPELNQEKSHAHRVPRRPAAAKLNVCSPYVCALAANWDPLSAETDATRQMLGRQWTPCVAKVESLEQRLKLQKATRVKARSRQAGPRGLESLTPAWSCQFVSGSTGCLQSCCSSQPGSLVGPSSPGWIKSHHSVLHCLRSGMLCT